MYSFTMIIKVWRASMNPIQSNPIQSNPIQSNPIQSDKFCNNLLTSKSYYVYSLNINHTSGEIYAK